jgi:hypothetical protein
MRGTVTLSLSVLFATAVALGQTDPESNAGSDRLPGSYQEAELVKMKAFVVTAARVGGRPWRYISIPGFEILSRCSDFQAEEYIRAIMRGGALEKMMLPDGCLASLSSPTAVILYDSDSPDTNSVSSVAPIPVTYGPGDEISWGDNKSLFYTPRPTYDVDSVVDCVRVFTSFLGGDNSIPPWVDKTSRFRLLHRVPQFPPWFVEGLIGPDGVFSRGTEIQYDAYRMPEGLLIPTARWISDSETKSVRGKIEADIPLPMEDLFGSRHSEQQNQSTVWLSEAGLFVRWGMYYTPPEPDHRASFWKLVSQATTGSVTEPVFRKCFGFGFKDLKLKLGRYLPKATGELVGTRFTGDWQPRVPGPRDATEVEIARIVGDWERIKGFTLKTENPALSSLFLAEAGKMLMKPYAKGNRDPELLGVLGLYDHAVGADIKARELLEAAAIGNVVRPSVYLTLAELRYHEFQTQAEGPSGKLSAAQVKAVLDPLFATRSRSPAMLETYHLIAEVWSQSAERPSLRDLAVLDDGVKSFWTDATLAAADTKLREQWAYRAEARP